MDFLSAQAISGRRRILAVWFPQLPTDRLQRRSGASADKPLVIVSKIENALRIHAVDEYALRLGLHAGHPLANARAMVPHIDVAEADELADGKLLASVADWCDRFTPYVALDAPHGLLLDITGVSHLFGGEQKMLETVRNCIAKQGFTVRVGLAGTAVAANALSRFAPGTIAEPGREAEALSSLPVASLRCRIEIEHALRRAGLKTVGQVASRQRAELASRFGKEVVFLLEAALGRGDKPISPRRPVSDLMAEHRFAEPVMTQEVITRSLRQLALNLSEVLEKRGEGARSLKAAFFRVDGIVYRLAIQTGSPTRDLDLILRLLQTKLDSLADPLDPGFGFDLIRLEAMLTQRLEPEAIHWGKDERSEREIARLIDELSTRFGRARVLRFHPQDTHIPEAEAVLLPAQGTQPQHFQFQRKRDDADTPQRPLRLLPKPEPVAVIAETPDGPPVRFRWRRVLHTACHTAGPETIAMEWWRSAEPMPSRDYYRVEDEEGRRFWLYRDGDYRSNGLEPRWFMHGLFA